MAKHPLSALRTIEPWAPHWTTALACAARAENPAPLLLPLVHELGFDGLTCIALTPTRDRKRHARIVCSTAPRSWAARYAETGYAGVDPRVTLTARRLSPIVWDANDVASNWAVHRFLADASRFDVRSGFAVSFRDASNARAVLTFDSGVPMTETRCASIVGMLGNLMLLAAALHERVMRPRCGAPADIAPSRSDGLTSREQQCLRMAANGLTSGDMGRKLGIAERTVTFHMRNVLRKMNAVNRPEAIAKALSRGTLRSAAAYRSV